jgi:hypothetical protein
MNIDKKQYKKYAEAHAPKSPMLKNCALAFIIGGTICALGQGLTDIYSTFLIPSDASTTASITLIFIATDLDGKETHYMIKTDKTTVGEALLEQKLIDGENGDYGLYVKTVNGITLDYDKDGKYWAFYENGNYATSGVDQTEIINGTVYSFKPEQ